MLDNRYHFIYAMSAICDMIECENGGTCSAPNECSCPAGWSGDTCAQGKITTTYIGTL